MEEYVTPWSLDTPSFPNDVVFIIEPSSAFISYKLVSVSPLTNNLVPSSEISIPCKYLNTSLVICHLSCKDPDSSYDMQATPSLSGYNPALNWPFNTT